MDRDKKYFLVARIPFSGCMPSEAVEGLILISDGENDDEVLQLGTSNELAQQPVSYAMCVSIP